MDNQVTAKRRTIPKVAGEFVELTLSENTVLLDCTISAFGNRGKIRSDLLGTNADKRLLHAHKTLLDSKEMRKVMSHLRKVRSVIRGSSVPSVFSGGVHLCSISAVQRIDDYLQDATEKLGPLLNDLENTLEDAKRQARERLADLYSEGDYPSGDTLQRYFSIRWRWLAFETPGKLALVDPLILARETEKAKDAIQDSVLEICDLLRTEFSALLENLVKRLGSDPEGKPLIFKEATVRNLSDFCDFFDTRNVVNDQALQDLVEKTRALLSGVDAKTLRGDSTVRQQAKKQFDSVLNDVELLPKPIRAFNWNEDSEVA